MSRSSRKLLFFVLASCAACDCSDDEPADYVATATKPGVDFTEYETFAVLNDHSRPDAPDAGIDPDDIPEDVIVNLDVANDQARIELEDRGLREIDDREEADLVVFSLASSDEESAYYWECIDGGWWGYWTWVWDPCAWLVPVYEEYTVGTVVVGLADPKLKDVVFGGLLQGIVNGSGNAEERIRDGVHIMFQDYPTQAPSE